LQYPGKRASSITPRPPIDWRFIVLHRKALLLIVLLALTAFSSAQQVSSGDANVTRATLDNGLRVVIIRDPLAPVATVEENYLVGANEAPPGFPGMAHALEHMIFRGCDGVTGDQISAIFAQLGGFGNAISEENMSDF
jgi:zinc protease